MGIAPTELSAGIVIVGISIAGAYDLATREVPDNVWRVVGVVGAAVVALTIAGIGSLLGTALWIVVAAYGLQSFFPWSERIQGITARGEVGIEAGLAGGVIAVLLGAVLVVGIGPGQVPYTVIAAAIVLLVARGLFEIRLLTGGADAKALIAMGLVLPIYPTAVIGAAGVDSAFLQVVPFAFNALVDGAVLTLVVPLAIAVQNLRAKEFHWRGGFTSYSISVGELPDRFVWVDDSSAASNRAALEAETAEEDRLRRGEIAASLSARGRATLRVTPQLPFVFFLAVGTIVAVLVGNLLWTVATVL